MLKKLALVALVLCLASQTFAGGLVAFYDMETVSVVNATGATVYNTAGSAATAASVLANDGVLQGDAKVMINGAGDHTLALGFTQIGAASGDVAGPGEGIQVVHSAALDYTSAFTISAQFIGATNTNGGLRAWGQVINKGDAYRFERNGNGSPTNHYGTGAGLTGSTLAATAWQGAADNNHHRVVVSYDGTNLITYLDGSLVGSVTGASTSVNNALELAIGYRADGVNDAQYEGWIDDVAIWTDAYVTAAGALALSHPVSAKTALELTYGAGEVIPEPATICLLGLGGLALIRRKRA